MLQPRKRKYRKEQRGTCKGMATRTNRIVSGEFAIQALEPGWVTARQIEAARVAIANYVRREARIWIRIFPYKPVTKKPLESRMGGGKGDPEEYVAVVKRGTILFEIAGVSSDVAVEALRRASHKLPIKTRIVSKEVLPHV
ncbi:MAG: 50S ribosomal protein L16 [Armatimonadota bacterium]|nr:50S ribosomal protein L16 [Armatimonadota bacterium]MCX7776926.1 50S ribosomal protein L16 [Armatimonadota bacterium]MDW8024759.1 50S ribosomal protein L16 [Armatimonadota bacterium]